MALVYKTGALGSGPALYHEFHVTWGTRKQNSVNIKMTVQTKFSYNGSDWGSFTPKFTAYYTIAGTRYSVPMTYKKQAGNAGTITLEGSKTVTVSANVAATNYKITKLEMDTNTGTSGVMSDKTVSYTIAVTHAGYISWSPTTITLGSYSTLTATLPIANYYSRAHYSYGAGWNSLESSSTQTDTRNLYFNASNLYSNFPTNSKTWNISTTADMYNTSNNFVETLPIKTVTLVMSSSTGAPTGCGLTLKSTTTTSATFTITPPTTKYGATISSYTVTTTAGSVSRSGTTVTLTMPSNLSSYSSITVSVYATDSRGFTSNTASASVNIRYLRVYPSGGIYNDSTSYSTFYLPQGSTKPIYHPTRTGYMFGGFHKQSNSTVSLAVTNNDSLFEAGTSVNTYNNSGGSAVTITRIEGSSPIDNLGGTPNYILQITNNGGAASPGLGGFYLSTQSGSSRIYRHIIWAKIPVGYTIEDARNSIGDGGYSTWLTPQEGTGDWEAYMYEVHTGSSGSFSTFGHIYLTHPTSKSVTWYVAGTQITWISGGYNNCTIGSGNSYIESYWAPIHYFIKYDGNGATSGAMPQEVHRYDEGPFRLNSNQFERDNYEFIGWNTKADGSGNFFYDMTVVENLTLTNAETIILYAQWIRTSRIRYEDKTVIRIYYEDKLLSPIYYEDKEMLKSK